MRQLVGRQFASLPNSSGRIDDQIAAILTINQRRCRQNHISAAECKKLLIHYLEYRSNHTLIGGCHLIVGALKRLRQLALRASVGAARVG